MYAIPGNANRGLKVGDDTSGPVFDPTTGDRQVTAARLKAIRAYLRRRMPALAKAPLVGSEVCQYEATPDSHYIVDRHPSHADTCGSPAADRATDSRWARHRRNRAAVLDGVAPDPTFALARLRRAAPRQSGREGAIESPQSQPRAIRDVSVRGAAERPNGRRDTFDTMAGIWPA